MLRDSSEHPWIGASNPARIWEVLRQTSIQQIEYPLFFWAKFLLSVQGFALC
jgi:hypothetical protein